jgi:hypothetical protein
MHDATAMNKNNLLISDYVHMLHQQRNQDGQYHPSTGPLEFLRVIATCQVTSNVAVERPERVTTTWQLLRDRSTQLSCGHAPSVLSILDGRLHCSQQTVGLDKPSRAAAVPQSDA